MENNLSRIKKYSDIDPLTIAGYGTALRHVTVNDGDKDLEPINVPLPECPDLREVDGFGLKAKDQKFVRQEIPKKLATLIAQSETLSGIHDTLSKEQKFYKSEIKWIKKQWYRLLNGYWFFNNGVPTYMDGWHYVYCNYWKLDDGLPDYRERDWKWFHFARFCKLDPNCLGFNYPKHRREGATSKACCVHYFTMFIIESAMGGIQSMTEKHASDVFTKQIVTPWKALPFFFQPMYSGTTDPQSVLKFRTTSKRLSNKGSLLQKETGLQTEISFRESSPKAYDSRRLIFYHDDEVGKAKDVDVYLRHNITKKCLSQGNGKIIHGMTIKTSTVGEMEKGGGHNFHKLCKGSHYHKKKNGRTLTGLYNLFITATEGLDGFIDIYGNSVIEDPDEPVMGVNGEWIEQGSRPYLEGLRRAFIEEEDYEGLAEEIRQTPVKFRECFRKTAKSSGFNIAILESRIDTLLQEPKTVRGNLNWSQGFGSAVRWDPNPENGKFHLSYVLDPREANHKRYDQVNETWVPMGIGRFFAGADPFKFNDVEGSRKSNGAGAIWWKHDSSIDSPLKDVSEWKSNRFVCTYNNKVNNKNIYAEDMLKMCIYYGALMYPEINVPLIWDYFLEKGYAGYLIFDVEERGTVKKTPGANSGEKVKQEIFSDHMTYIETHGKRECHQEYLEECRDIEGPLDMKNHDLFTACGYARLGEKSRYPDFIIPENDSIDLGDVFEQTSY